jgi:UDP-N-acetylglucosamine 2-epimerase
MKVFSVVGNRPQFVKAAPTSVAPPRAWDRRDRAAHRAALRPELSQVFFEELGLDEPRYALDLRTAHVAEMQAAIAGPLREEAPDWVLVYGDTNSTLAGRAGGLRGRNPARARRGRAPERRPLDARGAEPDRGRPSLGAAVRAGRALARPARRRGVPGRTEVVGDVMADATRLFEPIARKRVDPVVDEPYDVLTIHREANTEPERLRRLIDGLNATGRTFVFLVHPRTRKALDEHGIEPGPQIRQLGPVGYLEMLALVARARAVVTDSGGLQKEAYWLGVPCVTLRPSTEWVDTVLAGANTLVDPDDPTRLPEVLERASFPAGRATALRQRPRSRGHRRGALYPYARPGRLMQLIQNSALNSLIGKAAEAPMVGAAESAPRLPQS